MWPPDHGLTTPGLDCWCVIGELPGDRVQAIPTLIDLMKDPSVVVRDTTAWTVGRICELLPEAAINEMYLPPLLQCLIEGLGAEPRVASNVCWVSLLVLPVAAAGTAAKKPKWPRKPFSLRTAIE